jgi:Do/DeqQ family serine protease
MLRSKFVIVAIFFAALFAISCKTGLLSSGEVPQAQPQTPAQPLVVDGVRTSYADVVDKTSPAVVRIMAERKEKVGQFQQPGIPDEMFRQFGIPNPHMGPAPNQRPQIERGLGSGVIVNSDGTILTNNHVVEGADTIKVKLSNNQTFDAKTVGTDKLSDLAVIKIEAKDLPFLTLGNSDSVRVGDIVLAIGNPLGIGQTVTAGIISAKGRKTGLSDGSFEDFLQTDAPINRGNSGGALVNLAGELVGINSQILSPGGANGGNIGIGFSIPSNMAKTVMEQLLKDGKVHRGRLGIGLQDVSDDLASTLNVKSPTGALVSRVMKGSSAEKAGLQAGDIITAINGEKIEDENVLRNKVAGTAPGTEIKLTVDREGSAKELTATLDELNPEDIIKGSPKQGENENDKTPSGQGGRLGVSLQPVTPEIAKQLGLDADSEGLVVTEIDPAGAAAAAGIARGDVILQVNKKRVKAVDDVKSALEGAGDKVALLVSRRGQSSFVVVYLN